ncbi:MAG: hypothetical protein K2H09_06295 [Treponemataceae bacterium]|nr:hypothetical protein [Treponemataceae bacterium]
MKHRAIIYTDNTEQVLPLAEFLVQSDWEIASSGATAEFLTAHGVPVSVEKAIDAPLKQGDAFIHLMDMVFSSRQNAEEGRFGGGTQVSLVCINVRIGGASPGDFLKESITECGIDLKRISLIRAAAKNYDNVLVLTDPADYQEAVDQLRIGSVERSFRLYLAGKALNYTSAYDAAASISILADNGFVDFPEYFMAPLKKIQRLHHGMNEQQPACLYSLDDAVGALSGMKKIQGRELDGTIIVNYFAAWKAVSFFQDVIRKQLVVETTDGEGNSFTTRFTPASGSVFVAAVRNGTLVCAALGSNVCDAYLKIFRCMPYFSGDEVLGCNAVIDGGTAQEIAKSRLRAIVAPDFTAEARQIFAECKDVRLVTASRTISRYLEFLSIDGGIVAQHPDKEFFKRWHIATKARPTQQQIDAMSFGMMLAMVAKSDAAVVVNDFSAIGVASGRTDKIEAVQGAVCGAERCLQNGLTSSDTSAEILASDSCIPFDDRIRRIADIGVKAVIQSGGTEGDGAFIDFCNERGIAMVFTGIRHLSF